MIAKERNPDTGRLIDVLAAVPVGGIVSLAAMSDAIGRDIEQCRYLLYAAIRHAGREHGALFASVRGQGYRRLPVSEIATIGRTAREKIRRTARRGLRSMEAGLSAANDVPNDVRIRLLQEQSALGLIEHVTRERNLPQVPEGTTRPLPIAVAGRAFLQAIGALPAAEDAPGSESPTSAGQRQ
ncbi:MAG: hypothetical protein AB7F35_06520 [Acetobacteraceae bacterium]